MKNEKFYHTIFGEDGHLDKKISSSSTKQLILMYFKDIKKINKKEIEPQLEQTVLNRLNSWITELVGTDYHLKVEDVIINNDIPETSDCSTTNIEIIVTVSLTEKLMNETGLNRKTPWIWNYILIAKESNKEITVIPFKNITKGTKLEVANIIFPKIKPIVRKDIDKELRKHIEEEHLFLTIVGEDLRDYSQEQIITTVIKISSVKHSELRNEAYTYDLIIKGQPHDISFNNEIKTIVESKTYNIAFKNITKGTKLEVEQHLAKVFIESVNKVFGFMLTNDEFIITSDASDSNDYSMAQKINFTITTNSTKVTNDLQVAITILGNAHSIKDLDDILISITKQVVPFRQITHGNKIEIENHLIPIIEKLISEHFGFTVLVNQDFTITIDCPESNDYSIVQNMDLTINAISSKICDEIIMSIKIVGQPHNINQIKDELILTNPRTLVSKKVYYKWELKRLILPEVNANFQLIINKVFNCAIKEYQDYSLEINSMPIKNYDDNPKKVQVIINSFGNKITGNFTIDIFLIREELINIELLSPIFTENDLNISVARENTELEIRDKILITTIQNLIKVIKEEHNIDVVYGTDFLIDLMIPTIQNCYKHNKIITKAIIKITGKGNKIYGQLKYEQVITYDLCLTNFTLSLPPINITLPKKIINQFVFIIAKNELENIINPVIQAKIETEIYKILRIKPILNYDYFLENDIEFSHQYFTINNFIFKIKIKGCEQIFQQRVIVKIEPENLNELILSPITHQLLYLNNYLNAPKSEIEQYLFSIVKDEFFKAIQNKYNNCAITANSIYSYENKYYELKSNINEIDNYQQPKNIIVTIESLRQDMLMGKIEVPIVVQGITKSLTNSEYLFYIEDKILTGDKNQMITIISN